MTVIEMIKATYDSTQYRISLYDKNEITITELIAWLETDLLIIKRQLKKLE